MSEHKILDMSNKEVGKMKISDEIFGVKPKKHLIKDVVVMQLAKRRGGNASTKTRSDVRGGGAKPFRQKGTGNARQGTSRSPINEGGGVVFGPHKRDYSFKIPKKAKKNALKSALSIKAGEKKLFVFDELSFAKPRTKDAIGLFSKLNIESALVIDGDNDNLVLSMRNIPGFKYVKPEGINVYDVMKHDGLIITKKSMEKVEALLK